MTDDYRNSDDRSTRQPAQKILFGWLLFPTALFPLVALLTYDWRSPITGLASPPMPSSNWIGSLGDGFAYYGYLFFGLAIWIVPVVCLFSGILLVAGRRIRPNRKWLWFLLFLLCASCLVQVLQEHAPGLKVLLDKDHLNLSNAGGVLGYLLMTRLLCQLLSNFGASVIVSIVMAVSLVAAIGLENLVAFFVALYRWATVKSVNGVREPQPGDDNYDEQQEAYLAALRAKEAAREQARVEKEQARAEKERARQEREAEKERIRQEREDAKERLRQEKEAARLRAAAPAQPAAAPMVPAPAPKAQPAAAASAASEPVADKGPYILPPVSLLAPRKASTADHSDVGTTSQRLIDTLKLFGVDATMSYTVQGPVVTKYAIMLAPGTRYATVTGLQDNLKGALHAKSLRIEAPIPGEEAIGIEVPNVKPAGITFREIFESDAWRNAKAELPLLFGKRADGKELVADLATMPHMLVAGATGQGKSVCLNSLISGLLMTRTPEQLKLIMVDPKCVEFTPYSNIPHLLVPVITDNRKVVFSLHWAVAEMEKRLKLFARAKVRNIYDFNHRKSFTQTDMFGQDTEVGNDMPRTVPYIVIIIDEAADLIGQCGKEVNPDIQRITQKARAAGIHLILATQRPDAKIITGAIKANIPGRVAFKTASSVDSRTILDDTGAENLIGRGDMLFRGKDGLLIRAQGAWISDEEIQNVTAFIEEHSHVEFDEKFAMKLGRVKEAGIEDPFASNEDDPDNQQKPEESADVPSSREMVKASEDADLFKRALECIINTNRASVSHFQRRLGIGYNHAAKLCDKLEDAGVIAPQSGAGPRTILLDQNQLLTIFNGGNAASAADAVNDTAAPTDDEGLAVDTEEQV